jgi:hypothetical protein
MKAIITGLFLCFTVTILASEVLYNSSFSRLNDTQFRTHSFFSAGAGSCWPIQFRFEHLSNDTLYLELIFETRMTATINWCNRVDTMTQTNLDPGIHYVNVSTGIITFDSTDQTLGDTLWHMFDSTFNAVLGLEENATSGWSLSYTQDLLTVNGKEPIGQIQVVDLSGQQVMLQSGNVLDVSELVTGIYLLRVLTESGGTTIRWYRE